MAGRDPIHGGVPERSELAALTGVHSAPVLSQRLLPFEYQLIEQLGCTPDEYLYFKQRVEWYSRERPADYAHIPEVNNDVVTAIVTLVIGLVFQGIGYLLTPKPQLPEQRTPQNRVLDSLVGRDRFAPTYGFQTTQELSRYNELIPIVFTEQKQVQLNTNGTPQTQYVGGIMISPKLVWSRLYSWGSYQSVELVFLAGQGPLLRGPYGNDSAIDRAGIYLGQLPLDSFSDGDYHWYYYEGASLDGTGRAYAANSRLTESHGRYGSFRKTTEAGTANAFDAITLGGNSENGFTHAFSPSTQLRFGVYSALPNGTPYRLNFEFANGIFSQDATVRNSAAAKAIQLMGGTSYIGTGRNYARQFGIVQHNDTRFDVTNRNDGTKVEVTKGDIIDVVYNSSKVQEKIAYNDKFWTDGGYTYRPDTTAYDNKSIQSYIQTEHEQQDDALKVGTRWLIGNCLWEVFQRNPTNKVYDKNDTTPFGVRLRCIEVFGDGGKGYVGVCARSFVTTTTHIPEGYSNKTDTGPLYDINEAWFPICKAEFATFQNTRRCEITEIGLKSNVWTRLSGLCNFNSLMSIAKFLDVSKTMAIAAGTIQSYIRRASFFNVYVRPANNTFNANEGWEKLNEYPYCVVGSNPQDQFNFIRISHEYEQFEFRFRPISSGELIYIITKTKEVNIGGKVIKGPCVRLNNDGQIDNPIVYTDTRITSYGTFTIRTRGFVESIATLATNTEMVSSPSFSSSGDVFVSTLDTVRLVRTFIPSTGKDATDREISNGLSRAIDKDPDKNTEPYPMTYFSIAAGAEYKLSEADKTKFQYDVSGKIARLNLHLRCVNLGTLGTNKRSLYWSVLNGDAIPTEFTGAWKAGDKFTITSKLQSPNTGGGATIEYTFEVLPATQIRVSPAVKGDRIFEENSGVAEVSHYGNLISHSCDNGPEHEITYINESFSLDGVRNGIANYAGCAMAGLKIRSGINLERIEQLHIYQRQGLSVTKLRLNKDGVVTTSIGASNVFTDLAYYLLTDKITGAGELIDSALVDTKQLARTAMFLEANHLYYDDVIVEPQNLREFLSRISTSLLCNLVIRGGAFSIEPALPINGAYSIYDVKVPISGIFTEGNIIEDTFQLEYTQYQDRGPLRTLVRYRTEIPNRFPQEQTTVVCYTDDPNGPLQEFNFTHITSRYHAELFAKFVLSSRRHKTHAVTFKTLPYGLGLAPGDFIRVVTQIGYTQPTASGVIDNEGNIVCHQHLAATTYAIYYWDKSDSDIKEGSLTVEIVNDLPKAKSCFNTIFAIKDTDMQSLVYMVESLDLDEEGLVQITASYFPVDSSGISLIAQELKPTSGLFTVVADLSPDT